MKKKLGAVFSVAIGLLMATGSLWAHHSDALYDMSRLKVIKGTVTKHQLLNPHQVIRMKVKDASAGSGTCAQVRALFFNLVTRTEVSS